MSASRMILDCLPSFCQKLSYYRNWWKFDKVITKTILLVFFLRHGVEIISLSTI